MYIFNLDFLVGKRIIKKVYRKEDIYHGPYLDSAPDLVLLANKGFNLRSSLSQKSVIASPSIFSGKHSFDNAFFLANTAFRGSSRISSIFDVGRTIQEMLV